MADVLKVKVNNEWVGITSIQGPQGIQGIQGNPGPQGDPGSEVSFGTNSDIIVEPTTGTVVVANPATTTDTLTGITIGDTSYAVGGGGESLYRHSLTLTYNWDTPSYHVYFTLITKSSVAFTKASLCQYVYNSHLRIPTSGMLIGSDYQAWATYLLPSGDTCLELYFQKTDGASPSMVWNSAATVHYIDDQVSEIL